MRTILPWFFLLQHSASACTVFKTTHNGHTIIGNNEDAWSINAQVRFEPGIDGGYGAIYFDHYNGHPFRKMGPQLGMNEAGLVFDGLSIQPQHTTPVPGRKRLQFDELMPLVMRTCATVHEAATLFRAYDFSWLSRSMLFFADRNGDYLIVESDTMIVGYDASYAAGNWRMGSCTDPDAIPIPRLQYGRQMLMSGSGASLDEAQEVLSTMSVCRKRMGEGTLFSALFDPAQGQVHLYFYHDFSERVTFDLKEELAKGVHTVDMASLFGARPEYDRLQAYITPFHQRWLFWSMMGLAVLAGLLGAISLVQLIRIGVGKLRGRTTGSPVTPLLTGLASATLIGLIGVLLVNEGVFYFGLGDVNPVLAWFPFLLIGLLLKLMVLARSAPSAARWRYALTILLCLPFIGLLGYWGLLVP